MERNWLDKIYIDLIEDSLLKSGKAKFSSKEIKKILDKTFPKLTLIIEKDIKRQSRIILKEQRAEIRDFRKRLISRWKKPIDLLEIFISYNLNQGIVLSNSFRKEKGENVKFETLLRLHARSCQLASEILELLKTGFADGALARWRTLYEISIFANFLKDRPDELCQKYLDYFFVETYLETNEFQNNYKKLKQRSLSKSQINKIQTKIDQLKERYGVDFVKSYGWASDYLSPQKRNFKGMEELTDVSHMRPHYKWANNYVHGGPKGFLYKAGTYKQEHVMLAGPSNYGLADPGQNTAYSLFQTTLTLIGFENYLEDALFAKISESMLKEIGTEFIKVQKEIEYEEKLK